MTVKELRKRLAILDDDETIAVIWYTKDEVDEDISDEKWATIAENFFSDADDLCKDYLDNAAYDD
ncbi:MAG: hypothetical protein WDZ94_01745 [Patescibacteria group bacterium]